MPSRRRDLRRVRARRSAVTPRKHGGVSSVRRGDWLVIRSKRERWMTSPIAVRGSVGLNRNREMPCPAPWGPMRITPMDHARRRRSSHRRRLAWTILILVIVAVTAALVTLLPSSKAESPSNPVLRRAAPVPVATTTTTTSPFRRVPPGPPADQRTMSLIDTIGGAISPKSVSASDTGLVFAQNMMYRHTMTVYNSSWRARGHDPRHRRLESVRHRWPSPA